ncbi:hypothetical protein K7640_27465 [Micromonospora sp. PLK6-60]|uniref:hypothetical protein n=1 Tax=Micromonospora sp. PLK6-60 TaxID=2873383 RepID=UPI001CA61892|nr:hypothetical protein [Micromonospora sp. PLK6-60]MBY8875574.1 hypothetical protein [Micromonospora sp. PLK6-60]
MRVMVTHGVRETHGLSDDMYGHVVADTGEVDGGRYFRCSDQVIVPEPGVGAMVAAVDEMIRSGDIEVMCRLIEDRGA